LQLPLETRRSHRFSQIFTGFVQKISNTALNSLLLQEKDRIMRKTSSTCLAFAFLILLFAQQIKGAWSGTLDFQDTKLVQKDTY